MPSNIVTRPAEKIISGVITVVAGSAFPNFDVSRYSSVEVALTVISNVGGAAPTIAFSYWAVDEFNNIYNLWTSAAVAVNNNASQNIGLNAQTNRMLLKSGQLQYGGITGGPTSMTFNYTVLGRA